MSAKHTPTPWEARGKLVIVRDPSLRKIAEVGSDQECLRIVRAVNSHETMVAALRKAETAIISGSALTCEQHDALVDEINAALRLAEGGQS